MTSAPDTVTVRRRNKETEDRLADLLVGDEAVEVVCLCVVRKIKV